MIRVLFFFFFNSDFINLNAEAIKIQPKTGKKFCSTFIKICIRRKTRSKNSKIYLQKSTILYEEMREKK